MKASLLAVAVLSMLPASVSAQLTSFDYPPLALRMNHEGTVAYRLHYGPDGRATNCTVTRSSSYAELDDATCMLMVRRARFTPGSSGTKTGSVSWHIPPSTPYRAAIPTAATSTQLTSAYQRGKAEAAAAMAANDAR